MASVGDQIVQAMCDALNAPSGKPCATYRTRIDALPAVELPAMVLYSMRERPELKGPDTMKRTRTVGLEIMVNGRAPSDALIDPLYVYAVQTLQADPTLAPLLRKLTESELQWETVPSDQDTTVMLLIFEAVFMTKLTDPTVRIDF